MGKTAKQKSLQRIIDPEELDDFYPAWDADDNVEDEEADELVEEPVAGGKKQCFENILVLVVHEVMIHGTCHCHERPASNVMTQQLQ